MFPDSAFHVLRVNGLCCLFSSAHSVVAVAFVCVFVVVRAVGTVAVAVALVFCFALVCPVLGVVAVDVRVPWLLVLLWAWLWFLLWLLVLCWLLVMLFVFA